MSFGMTIEDGQIVSMQDGHMPNDFTGLDASKSANPGVGDVYKATDTSKEYACFVTNVWSLISSPCYEEYNNHTATWNSFMSSTGSVLANYSNHRFDLNLISVDDPAILDFNRSIFITTEPFELNMKVNNISNGALGVGVQGMYTDIGLGGGNVNVLVRSHTNSSNVTTWIFYTGNNAGSESTAIPDIVDNDLITFKNFGNIIMLYINGELQSTHSIVDYSGQSAHPQVFINGDGSDRTISLDYIGWRIYK